MNHLAIIPARGGSKRIPDKNIRPFLGKPIMAYSIELALESGLFEEVMVSTDSARVAEVARSFGASIPFMRSEAASGDTATLADVMKEVIAGYKAAARRFDCVCCILPTSPLLTQETLKAGLQMMMDGGYDSVRPIVRFPSPVQRAFRHDGKGRIEMIHPEYFRMRSQDLEPAFYDAGQFYWFRFENGISGPNRGAIVISEKDAQDIDTPEDWEAAEMKFAWRHAARP